jgi:hypothetical protein
LTGWEPNRTLSETIEARETHDKVEGEPDANS